MSKAYADEEGWNKCCGGTDNCAVKQVGETAHPHKSRLTVGRILILPTGRKTRERLTIALR